MKSTTNVFSKGLTTDLHPMQVANTQMTDALNATFLTYNGNEMMLQNDMGNTRIQDKITGALMGLKEGFIPVAMQERGGVLYIASYNPNTKISELGSIPSPLFSYTHAVTNKHPHNTLLLTIEDSKIEVQNNPIIISNNQLFSVGDGVTCGFDIDKIGIMERVLDEKLYTYPTISTLGQTGLLTLHLLALPSDGGTQIDLKQHLGGENDGVKQWFYDLNEVNEKQKVIQYPNFKSGHLAIQPELQTISDVMVLKNNSTKLNEPYYTEVSMNVVKIKYTKQSISSSDSKFNFVDDSKLELLLTIDGEPEQKVNVENTATIDIAFFNSFKFTCNSNVNSLLYERQILGGDADKVINSSKSIIIRDVLKSSYDPVGPGGPGGDFDDIQPIE